ncbi:MAG: TetR/AcrR family transcriptional regulator [Lachnospiraceae bacterium]|nr:TetR/AcrR family transcriptional regulator [Lachnospiraceae bacterium]
MEKNGYHHGDLRRSLIETGIELISQEGEENISLRKVAAKCGVSNAAPYAHFKNKDEFIMAIQQYVMDLFTTSLEETATKYENTSEILPMLGKTYVMFFYHNPLYYDFLFSRKNIKIMLSMDSNGETENQPLEILKNAAMKTLSRTNMTTKMIQDKTIAMWALVHGLANIVTMPNVEYDDNWESRIEEIIKAISISPTMKENGK